MDQHNSLFNQIATKQGLMFEIAPFTINVKSSIPQFQKTFTRLYSDYPLKQHGPSVFADFHIRIDKPAGIRGWIKPQVRFYFDGAAPFTPLPISQAFPSFEWGLNWCVANHAFQYLIIHAAVVERKGYAIIFPGEPGAGKSTLCAALANRGWRLFSDEMAIIDLDSRELIPLVRPISLKNQSIDIIKKFAPEAEFGEHFLDTSKGVIAHMKAPAASLQNASKRAVVKAVIFPRYNEGSATQFCKIPKYQTVLQLAEHSFNYNALGKPGFDTLCQLVRDAESLELKYSDLDSVIGELGELADKNK